MDVTSPSAEDEDGVEEEEGEEDGGGGGGWITPGNIKRIQMDAGEVRPPENVTVGCVTTDFAMQVRTVGVRRCPAAESVSDTSCVVILCIYSISKLFCTLFTVMFISKLDPSPISFSSRYYF